jgi:acid phosphatase class B
MSKTLLETVRLLEQRAEYLEKEAALLRQELAQVADELAATSPVVVRYTIEDETYEITQADVDIVRAKMIKPRSEETLRELALVDKMAERHKHLSREERILRLQKALEASRAAAIADGTAIENEWEAAIDD